MKQQSSRYMGLITADTCSCSRDIQASDDPINLEKQYGGGGLYRPIPTENES